MINATLAKVHAVQNFRRSVGGRGLDIVEQQRQGEGHAEENGNGGHVEEENDGQAAYLAAEHQNPVGSGLRHRMGLFDRIGQPDGHGRDEEETEDKAAYA